MCTHPIRVRGMLLPCGRCTFCKIAKTKEWSVRLLCESLYWKEKCMVTLTYNDLYLPSDGSLVKDDLRNFFKRLRDRIKPNKIKYFACGEYGEDKTRPHYHICLLGCEDEVLLNDCWRKGFIYVRPFVWETVKYVCQYVYKKYGEKFNRQVYGDLQPPFQFQSNGIGKDFCDDYADNLRQVLAVPVKGEPINLPRYFAERLGIKSSDLIAHNSKKNHKNSVVFSKRLDKRIKKVIDNIHDLKDLNKFQIEDYADDLQNEIDYQREFNQNMYDRLRSQKRGFKRW